MPRAANDSSVTPQPVSGLARPASVYITVSRSGQTRRPHRSKSSAVLTTTERSPGLPPLARAASRPPASFAPPTPPARATVFNGFCPVGSWNQATFLVASPIIQTPHPKPRLLPGSGPVRNHLHPQHSV